MHDQEQIRRFIELRSSGLSFAAIAAELKVSKPTLINWSRKYQFEIHNLRAIETEALAEKLLASRGRRWEALARDLTRIETELGKRDLAEVSTARLISLAAMLRRQISSEVGNVRFSENYYGVAPDQRIEEITDWTP